MCGLPLEHISETMRPLPLEPINGMPPFVLGLSIIRGAPLPVVDLPHLMGQESGARRTRLVVVKVKERCVALAVDLVLGIGRTPGDAAALPPLLRDANAEFVSTVASLDSQLLVLLESGLILAASAWQAFENRGGSA